MELHVQFYLIPYYKGGFTIINPSTIPAEGDLVFIEWEDFLDDQNAIDAMRKIEETTNFYANIQSRSFFSGGAKVTICLLTEYDYYKDQVEKRRYIAESLQAGHMIDLDL